MHFGYKGGRWDMIISCKHEMDRIERMETLISNFSRQFVYFFISTGLSSQKFYLNLRCEKISFAFPESHLPHHGGSAGNDGRHYQRGLFYCQGVYAQ